MMVSRRSITGLVQRAIVGGKHRVEILPDGRVSILPLSVDPAQAQDAALDAEIRELIGGHGDARH